MIYLDNNASTPVDPEVSDAIFSCLKRDFGNPSSSHMQGRRAKELIESSRAAISAFLECSPDEIYFTSGGTESNNLALLGTAMLHHSGHIITSAIEHPSVFNVVKHLESMGFEVTFLDCDSSGIIKPEELSKAVKKNTFLISIMHANNETGVLQPIEELGAIAKRHGIVFHVDAAQSIGKSYFTLNASPVDMLTLVPHKFYGPKGIGGLYIKNGCRLSPLMFGANHERGLRPGTENVPGIAGFAKTCQIAMRDIKLRVSHTTHLREILFRELQSGIPGILLNGHRTKRLPNTLNVYIPGIPADGLVNTVREQVAISSGSACHSGNLLPSRVLKCMGLSDREALSSIRLSVGKDNTEDDIQKAAGIIINAVRSLRKDAPRTSLEYTT
ncbi:MAG: cysteine desulfurase, partial [Nitrospirota bacterium]|nr:cysteine desulfurase [Nitrospirota bacterium]